MANIIRHKGVTSIGTNVSVIFRSLQKEPDKCLVLYHESLPEVYYYKVMQLIDGVGQKSNNLWDIMDKEGLLEGSNMLTVLHTKSLLRKLNTSEITMLPGNGQRIRLDELNKVIADAEMSGGKIKDYNPFESTTVDAGLENGGLAARLMNESEQHRIQAEKLYQRAVDLDPSLARKEVVSASENSTFTIELPADISAAKAIETVKKAMSARKSEGNKDE